MIGLIEEFKNKATTAKVKWTTAPCEEVCKLTSEQAFNEEAIEKISKKLGALANPIRLKIGFLILTYKELTTCEFERALNLPQSVVSYHLQALCKAGILKRKVHGPWSFYSLVETFELTKLLELAGGK